MPIYLNEGRRIIYNKKESREIITNKLAKKLEQLEKEGIYEEAKEMLNRIE